MERESRAPKRSNGKLSASSSVRMNRTTDGPIGIRSDLRISGTKTENRVPAWASSRHFRASSQSRFAYQSWPLGSILTRRRAAKVHRSCSPAVRVMKSAENRSTNNDAMRLWSARYWPLQIQRAMRSITVVVMEELGEQREQMALIQHDDVVKTLLAKGPHYPFRHRVCQRRPVGCFVIFDANASELAPEVSTVHIVPITNEVSRLTAPGGGFDHLSPDPGRRRARGDLALNQPPPLVTDEEEHIQALEADRLHHEQVCRPDSLDLIP